MTDKMKRVFHKGEELWKGFLDLLYPPRCAFCHRLLGDKSAPVCPDCLAGLPYASGDEARQSFGNVSLCVSPLYYEGFVRDSLLRYKFHGVTAYAPVYAEMIRAELEPLNLDCSLITWVPLSRKRLRTRGYDQARLIAEELAKLEGKSCEGLLKKVRNNAVQSKTGGYENRKRNVAGVYAFSGGDISGKSILLIDDIATTGSTLSEAAGVLLAAGAEKVTCASVARKRN